MKILSLKNILILPVIFGLIIGFSYLATRYALSKDNVSYPQKDHSHFRIKYIFNGEEENFGGPKYQTDYTKDICGGTLTESPLHFHDNKTDYQHLHWTRWTGGQFLKFYGLNYIGGLDGYMGFKLDKLPVVTPVPIFGNLLPKPRPNDKLWIYTGKEEGGVWEVQTKTIEQFVNNDFETFFGTESQVRKDTERYGSKDLDLFNTLQVNAHGGIDHKTMDEETNHKIELSQKSQTEILNNQVSNSSQNNLSNINLIASAVNQKTESNQANAEELKSINNFLGDVVIFVQPEAPSPDQVQARFKNMIKLDKSVCGG